MYGPKTITFCELRNLIDLHFALTEAISQMGTVNMLPILKIKGFKDSVLPKMTWCPPESKLQCPTGPRSPIQVPGQPSCATR